MDKNKQRECQGYVIEMATVVADGHYEIVFGCHRQTGLFVTWERNLHNDKITGHEDFYWGHYFGANQKQKAINDYNKRIAEK